MKLFFPPPIRVSHQSLRLSGLRLVFLLVLAIGLAVALPQLSSATRQSQSPDGLGGKLQEPEAVPGQILVRFRKGAVSAKTKQTQSLTVNGGRQIDMRVEGLSPAEVVEGLRLAYVRPEDTETAIEALRSRFDVQYAEPNYLMRSSAIPNDPQFADMQNLRNTGQMGSPGHDIGAELAWDITTGSDAVVIGVVDTGIDIEHPDLNSNIWRNSAEVSDNGVDDDGNGYIDDLTGWDFYNNDKTVFDSPTSDAHGTHVAGTIGAAGNNGVGAVGVSWHVKLMPLKFLGSSAGTGSTSQAISALQYAKMMRDRGVNLRAVNNSWGGRFFSQALQDVIGELNASGILFVAAAGNEGMDNDSFSTYPANYELPNVISVGAENGQYSREPFSNFGTETVDIYAPGGDILSTLPGASYARRSGTSMAAPHVTGTAALICAARPGISLSQLRNAILFGSFMTSLRETKLIVTTHLRADGALQSALENDTVPPGSVTDLRASRVGQRIDLAWTASGDNGSAGGNAVLYKIVFVDSVSQETMPLQSVQPVSPGSAQNEAVYLPYQHTSGKIKLIPFDNAGNEGLPASVDVSVNNIVTNPYVLTTSAASPLSTGGVIPVGLRGDDKIFGNLGLPFDFRFFGRPVAAVTVSTNGTLYFLDHPAVTDALSTTEGLNHYPMIAGLWDDLRTDRRPEDGVYMVTPDPDRVIFRWQGVTFDTPLPNGGTRGEHPVSFEIELQRSGDIVIRYGAGNDNVWPIVGMSGGERESYLVGSHSFQGHFMNGDFMSLGNAATITFTQPPCSAILGSTTQTASELGGFGSVTVDNGGACAWNAVSNVSWIRIDFGASSIGSGRVSYFVSGNNSADPRSGTLTIAGQTVTVNQSGTVSNPIDDSQTFVTQHYRDFLNREPDPTGLQFWMGNIESCGSDAACRETKRIDTSAAYFLSIEFQETGYLVHRFYKASFGRRPLFSEFLTDTQAIGNGVVVNSPGWQQLLENNKLTFINAWVTRAPFMSLYDNLSNAQYVDKLIANTGASFTQTDRDALVDVLDSQSMTRAQVLRLVAENHAFYNAEYNAAFVEMQYFGYLRRNPQDAPDNNLDGYNFWLNKLNEFNGDFRRAEMVKAFLVSGEYRQRFVSH